MPKAISQERGFLYPLAIGDEVNFRLTYDGPLKAASQSDTRRLLKHQIRCVFSRQLEALYDGKGELLDGEMTVENMAKRLIARKPFIARKGNLAFLALVREDINLVCDLDILFLRREEPGHLISGGGDLDNRIKVLFDALRIPQDDNEVRGISANGTPLILCLTEDDRLITGFRVTADRLLEPANSESEKNDVRLVINVEVKATKLTPENMAYFSHF